MHDEEEGPRAAQPLAPTLVALTLTFCRECHFCFATVRDEARGPNASRLRIDAVGSRGWRHHQLIAVMKPMEAVRLYAGRAVMLPSGSGERGSAFRRQGETAILILESLFRESKGTTLYHGGCEGRLLDSNWSGPWLDCARLP